MDVPAPVGKTIDAAPARQVPHLASSEQQKVSDDSALAGHWIMVWVTVPPLHRGEQVVS